MHLQYRIMTHSPIIGGTTRHNIHKGNSNTTCVYRFLSLFSTKSFGRSNHTISKISPTSNQWNEIIIEFPSFYFWVPFDIVPFLSNNIDISWIFSLFFFQCGPSFPMSTPMFICPDRNWSSLIYCGLREPCCSFYRRSGSALSWHRRPVYLWLGPEHLGKGGQMRVSLKQCSRLEVAVDFRQ